MNIISYNISKLSAGYHVLKKYCSDFRYESNKILVLGVVFFVRTNFDFLSSNLWRNFLNIIYFVV